MASRSAHRAAVADTGEVTTRRTIARAGSSVTLLALVLSGCGTSTEPGADATEPSAAPGTADGAAPAAPTTPAAEAPDEPAESSAEPAEPADTAAAEVPEQLDFTATTVDGATFDGAEVAGQDTLFYFWAPWCTICRATAPGLAEFAAERDDVRLVTVGGSSSNVDEMADFVADVGLGDFPNVADTTGEIWTRFGVTYQYTYVFVDDSGSVEVVTGPLDKDELTTRFDALVAS